MEQWYIYSFLFCILKSKENTAKIIKKESSCHKLKFSNPYIYLRISLKNQRSTTSGCKDVGIKKAEFVAKT